MKFYIEEVLIVFPYDYIYPEQLEYMQELKKGLDRGGHVVLEMPSGTGKTISLLSLLVAYIHFHAAEKRKVVYCTRTVVEMTKTVEELKRLVQHWAAEGHPLSSLRGLCLSARKNLCIEPRVASHVGAEEVDAACRMKTAPWASNDRCTYFDTLEGAPIDLPAGVFTLDDIKEFGAEHNVCPYFLIRKALPVADIIVHSFLYMVDPSLSGTVREHLSESTIVVMDEGHNVDDVCIGAMSMVITKKDAAQAREANMKGLLEEVDRMKSTNRQKLQQEYDSLISGLALAAPKPGGPSTGGGGALAVPAEVADDAMPGNLRQASHFLAFLQRLVDFIHRLVCRITRPYVAEPLVFLTKVREECAIDIRHLRFVGERLRLLLNTLEISESKKYRHVVNIGGFFTTLATYYTDSRHERPGFVVICQPRDPRRPEVEDPTINLVCVDASLAVRDVFGFYRSVVLTSGTLSPLEIYPKILGFQPVVSKSFQMTLSRKCIAPLIVTRSSEHTELSSSFKVRKNPQQHTAICTAYSNLIIDLAQTVPDGIVCFFTGYEYMSEVMLQWHSDGTLQKLAQHKLIFVETQAVQEISVSLANYRRACDTGRGAIFMSIARGKIAEGIDFDRHYGRAVLMFGVPFLPPTDEALQQRMHWMEHCLGIPEGEFRNFDAMRHASQCIGRVLRNKTDYGMMILVDQRFSQSDRRRKLPGWIQQCLKENTNLSVEEAVSRCRTFFKEMAQPWDHEKDLGTTLLGIQSLVDRGMDQPSEATAVQGAVGLAAADEEVALAVEAERERQLNTEIVAVPAEASTGRKRQRN